MRKIANIAVLTYAAAVALSVFLTGCGNNNASAPATNTTTKSLVLDKLKTEKSNGEPVFTLDSSEYPSWSLFGVAAERGLIDPAPGRIGSLEKKHGVDIHLKFLEYDPCVLAYGTKDCDAVCITNFDVLSPSFSRQSTAILPTSTSFGGDACIAVGIDSIEGLKGKKVYGLANSVSEFVFVRALQVKNLNPDDFIFVNRDPGAASQSFQVGDSEVSAIMVWNPFALQSERTRPGAKRVFDSTVIPKNEVVDMVVLGNDVLARPSGKDFAKCVCDVYYQGNKLFHDPDTADAAYSSLGAKFSNLGVEDMKICCQQTKFFGTAEEGLVVFESSGLKETMKTVTDFCLDPKRQIIKSQPKIGYDDPSAQLNFSTEFMKAVK